MSYENKDSMRKILKSLKHLFENDEILNRLLYYYPEDNEKLDPLDPALPNIIVDFNSATDAEIERMYSIRRASFKTVPSISDLEGNEMCRIYMYADERNPSTSKKLSDQNVTFDVFCHYAFEEDYRTARIVDRIESLMGVKDSDVKSIAGVGKPTFVRGRRITVLKDFSTYTVTYQVGVV